MVTISIPIDARTMTAANGNSRMWDQFWSSGRGACCSVHQGVDYAEDFRQPWNEFFSSLQASDSILDLCTGNGAVLRTASQQAEAAGISVRLDGVDLAHIEPRTGQEKITFHAQVDVTDLPFDDQVFDYVSSQFGIEYAAPESACREAVRVLKPGAKGRFIVHAAEGITAAYAQRELADLDELLHDIGIFPAAAEALRAMCDVERQEGDLSEQQIERARGLHKKFFERLTLIGDTWQQRSAQEAYRDTGSLLQHTLNNRAAFPVEVLLDKIRETEEAVVLHRARLQALINAALDSADCEQLSQQLKMLGCTSVSVQPLHNAGGDKMLGWCIDFQS